MCCFGILDFIYVHILGFLLLFQGLFDIFSFAFFHSSDETQMHYYNPIVLFCDINLQSRSNAPHSLQCKPIPGNMTDFTYNDRSLLIKAYQWELRTRFALGIGCLIFGSVLLVGEILRKTLLVLAVEVYILIMVMVYLCVYILAGYTVSTMTTWWWWWFLLGYVWGIFWRSTVYLFVTIVLHLWRLEENENKKLPN